MLATVYRNRALLFAAFGLALAAGIPFCYLPPDSTMPARDIIPWATYWYQGFDSYGHSDSHWGVLACCLVPSAWNWALYAVRTVVETVRASAD